MFVWIFWLKSVSWSQRISAEAWSLNGRTIRTGFDPLVSAGEETDWSDTFEAKKRVTAESISFSKYSSLENNCLRRSHSSEEKDQSEESRNARRHQEVSVCWFHVNLCLNVCRFVQFDNCVLRNGSMPLFSVSMVNLTEEWQWFRVSSCKGLSRSP